jgi:hypothetical protein
VDNFASRIGIGVAVLVVALTAVAGCSTTSGGSKSGGQPSGATPVAGATTGHGGGGGGGGSLATSKLIGLTKLDQTQLCGVMNTNEASQIMGSSTAAGKFTNTLGLGVVCQWQASGSTELYVGLSTILDWTGAQGIDKLFTTTSDSIDGHPALVIAPQKSLSYATVDLALGGDHDPVAEYRAPSVAQARSLATLVTPRLLALS